MLSLPLGQVIQKSEAGWWPKAWRAANVWLGAQLSTGSRASLAPWPLHQDSGHMLGGSSGLPRGQKQDPPSFLKVLADRWYRVPPVPSCGLKRPESSIGALHPGRAWVQKARSSADLCWPLSGTLPALPFQVVSSSVDGGLVPPQHPSCGLLAPRPASPPAALSRKDEGNRRCPGPSKQALLPANSSLTENFPLGQLVGNVEMWATLSFYR